MGITSDADSSLSADTAERRADSARRWHTVLLALAVLSLVVAVALSWWLGPSHGGNVSGSGVGSSASVPEPVKLDQNVLDLLPTRVIQYETITHQAVPGARNPTAEAVYKTLNMNMAAQIDVTVYARAEGLASDSLADDRLAELLEPYPLDASQTLIGQTRVATGYAPNRGSYVVAWTSGQYVTLVKSSYVEFVPAKEEDQVRFIKLQGDQVAKATEELQRLGKGGLRK